MTLYVLRRLASIVVVLVLISVIIFVAIHVLPGSAATLILGEYATPDALRTLERQMGLDRPLLAQYGAWVGDVLTGRWGDSLAMKQPVASVVALRLKNSATLAAAALVIVGCVAIPLGTAAALARGSLLDLAIVTATYVGISVPEFVTGMGLLLVLAGPSVGWFPTGGYADLSTGALAWVRHLALPTATLAIVLMAHVVRQTRSGLADVLGAPYIRTARLKGASERRVIVRHALRNGLVPTITVLALDLGYLMGGIVVVEEVFAYPGMGRLIIYAVQNRDVPLLQMCVLIVAAVYTLANFAADLLYAWLDPRIRYR
ncbi:MAG TPA: ABC transporter permease [Candidatus Methylomirabilis sp.]|nr:ABC transporter permease [Candidatus Methylomirabilis sp.]